MRCRQRPAPARRRCWAANILYVRAHRWISTPFQLVFWQALLATAVLSALALVVRRGAASKLDAGAERLHCSTAAYAAPRWRYWAIAMVNRTGRRQ